MLNFLECRAAACQFLSEIDRNFAPVLLVTTRKTHAGFVCFVAGIAGRIALRVTRQDSQKSFERAGFDDNTATVLGVLRVLLWRSAEIAMCLFSVGDAAATGLPTKPATRPARAIKSLSLENAGFAGELSKPAT